MIYERKLTIAGSDAAKIDGSIPSPNDLSVAGPWQVENPGSFAPGDYTMRFNDETHTVLIVRSS